VSFRRLAAETAASLLSGALFASALQLPGCGPLCWIAIVPWAVLYGRPGSRSSFLPAVPGILLYILIVWKSLLKYGAVFAVTISIEALVIYGMALLLLRETGRWWPSLPIAFRLPVLWTAMDYLLVRFEFFRTPVYFLPNPIADWPVLIQIADVFGGLSLAFPVAMVNGLVADTLLLLWRRRRERGEKPGPPVRAVLAAALTTGALIAVMLLYGLARIDRTEPIPGPRVALVQPALTHIVGWPIGVHAEELYQTARNVPAGQADIVMWPENSIMDFYDLPHRYLDDLSWLAQSRGASILFGGTGRAKGDPFRGTNQAVLLSPEGRIEGTYSKIDVIPWSEYLPFESSLSRFAPSLNLLHMELVHDTLGFFPKGTRGDGMSLFPYSWQNQPLPFAVILCSESGIPSHAREGTALGARFLVNLTSEGEAGSLLHRNMLRICSLRAVENRRPMVRVGNTGISCTIDESGRLRDILRRGPSGAFMEEAGVLVARIPLPAHSPHHALYTTLGDVFPLSCVALSGFAAAAIALRRRRMPGLAAAAALMLAIPLTLAGCRAAAARSPLDFPSALHQGVSAFQEGRYGLALKSLGHAADIAPEEKEPYRYIAEILRRRRKPFQGYRFFQARRRVAETIPEVASYLGYFQAETHQKAAAAVTLSRSLEQDPDQRAGLLTFVPLMFESNRAAMLLPYLERYLRIHPDDRPVVRSLGEALLAANRLESARKVLDGLLSASPEDAEALRLRGVLSLAEGRLEEATGFMDASARADPKSLETRYNQARIALRLGDFERARGAIDGLHQLEKRGEFHP